MKNQPRRILGLPAPPLPVLLLVAATTMPWMGSGCNGCSGGTGGGTDGRGHPATCGSGIRTEDGPMLTFWMTADSSVRPSERVQASVTSPGSSYKTICTSRCEAASDLIRAKQQALEPCLAQAQNTEQRNLINSEIERLSGGMEEFKRACESTPLEGVRRPPGRPGAVEFRLSAQSAAEQAANTCKCPLDEAMATLTNAGPCPGGLGPPREEEKKAKELNSTRPNVPAGGSITARSEQDNLSGRWAQAGGGSGAGNSNLLSASQSAATSDNLGQSGSLNFARPSPGPSDSAQKGTDKLGGKREYSPTAIGGGSSNSSGGSGAGGSSSGSSNDANRLTGLQGKDPYGSLQGGPGQGGNPGDGSSQSGATSGGFYQASGVKGGAAGGGGKDEGGGFRFGASGSGETANTPGSQSFSGSAGSGSGMNGQGIQDSEDYLTRIPMNASIFEIVERRYRKVETSWGEEGASGSPAPSQ